ncbi:MAG: hypothetical protein CSA97_03185 [Bacteroidetes bacterium]|nr:MAG: hypothetical protein CSA97_03185 [Bacteroidota bacterium]
MEYAKKRMAYSPPSVKFAPLLLLSLLLTLYFPLASHAASIGDRFSKDYGTYRLYFRITSIVPAEVELIPQNDTSPYWPYHYFKGSGTLAIPETVEDGAATYSVTSLANNAFRACYRLSGIELPASVMRIGKSAFKDCSILSYVKLPSSLQRIEDRLFSGCNKLIMPELPATLQSIGKSAFKYCSKITDVVLPATLQDLGNSAFASCRSLKSLELPATLQSIGKSAFSDCPKLGRIVSHIEDPSTGVPTMGEKVFESLDAENCVLIVPAGQVDKYRAAAQWKAFSCITDNPQLGTTFLRDKLYYRILSEDAVAVYAYDEALEGELIIPESVENRGKTYSVRAIGRRAFERCYGLASVTLPASLLRIGEEAFKGCESLASLELPALLESIGSEAFSRCSMLGRVVSHIPDPSTGKPSMGTQVFITSETCVLVTPAGQADRYRASPQWKDFPYISDDPIAGATFKLNNLYYRILSEHEVAVVPPVLGWTDNRPKGRLMIPHTASHNGNSYQVVAIARGAFMYCNGLKRVVLPPALESIEPLAFRECASLTHVAFPTSLQSIGESAFRGCALGGLRLPESLQRIGNQAFSSCRSLTDLELPASLQSIGESAFEECETLTRIVSNIEDPTAKPTLQNNVFNNVDPENCVLIVPAGRVDKYRAASQWNGFKHITDNPQLGTLFSSDGLYYRILSNDEVVLVPYRWDDDTRPKGNLTIPAEVAHQGQTYSVKGMANYAFAGCRELTGIELPASIGRIGEEAFQGCIALGRIASHIDDPSSGGLTMGSGVFNSVDNENCVLIVPSGKMGKYRAADQWKDFKRIAEAPQPLLGTTFEKDGLYYRILSDSEVALVPHAWDDDTRPKGDLDIPKTVSQGGATYTVGAIANFTFRDCSGLASVDIPPSVRYIGYQALPFSIGCIGINVADPASIAIVDPASWLDPETCILRVPHGAVETYRLADAWKYLWYITDHPLAGTIFEQNGLHYRILSADAVALVPPVPAWEDAKRPKGDLPISASASYSGRTYSLRDIATAALAGCDALASIELPASILRIGGVAFGGCTSLQRVTSHVEDPASLQLSEDIFLGIDLGASTLFVPKGAVDKYKAIAPWRAFGNIRVIPTNSSGGGHGGGGGSSNGSGKVGTPVFSADMEGLTVYPNPVVNSLGVSGLREPARAGVYTLQGQLLMQARIAPGQTLSVAALPPAVYLLRIAGETLRFVKR